MSKRFMLTAAGTASAAVAGIASAELIDFTVIQDQYIGEASYQIINSRWFDCCFHVHLWQFRLPAGVLERDFHSRQHLCQ